MSLSPWDLSGNISFDFSLYRPRRPSYVYATQTARRRNESYRHATKSDNSDNTCEPVTEDFIEGIQQARKKRKEHCPNKFGKAHGPGEGIELRQVDIINHVGGPLRPRALSTPNEEDEGDYESKDGSEDVFGGISAVTIHVPVNSVASTSVTHGAEDQEPEGGPGDTMFKSTDDPKVFHKSTWRYRKNLIVLSLSFILVFTAFRSIQNLQSSLNQAGHLGVIAMGCVHGTMFLTCLFAPVLINKLTSKWTIVLGLLFYLFWIAANFYPHFYTLIPTSIGVGFGQSLAWGAQVTYIQKLAVDYAHLSKELTHQELSKFNGIFLACFQTTHIWGNVISSLMLPSSSQNRPEEDFPLMLPPCGVYDHCEDRASASIWNTTVSSASEDVLKLMGSYIVFAFTGFILILLFLEKIGAKSDPEKPCLQMVWSNVRHLATHKTYRLLIPLLIFNGFEQGFVYADYTNSYVSCTIGVQYVGYNMITLGTANSIFSIIVGLVARHIPREAVIGIGSILHIGLMVFLLVWIPDEKLFAVFFVISGLWGICDAIWQTQCNCLVNLSCPDDHDVAFQNFRMLQGLGASLAFILGAFVCVSVKLYIIISLMILSIMCYCIAEYRIRRENGELDDSS